jgi:hypothetical protein
MCSLPEIGCIWPSILQAWLGDENAICAGCATQPLEPLQGCTCECDVHALEWSRLFERLVGIAHPIGM